MRGLAVAIGLVVLAACSGGPPTLTPSGVSAPPSSSTQPQASAPTPSGTSTTAPGSLSAPPPTPTATMPPSAVLTPNALAAELVSPTELTICTSFGRTRFAEYDASGRPFGVDVEIGQALAGWMQLDAELSEVAFETLIDAVAADRTCDVSIAGQFITTDRLGLIDMIPYREGVPHVVVRTGNPAGISAPADLCGRRFGVVAGTVFVDMVRGEGDYVGRGLDEQCLALRREQVSLIEFETQDEAEAALAGDEVDAYAGNDFVTVEQPEVFELAVELPRTRNGIGHAKGLTVLDAALRDALRAIIADGSYRAILDDYGAGRNALTITP